MMSLLIGIDYGISNKDIPMYTVARKNNDTLEVIDVGKIDEFDYRKYVATKHQIVGESNDLEKFKNQFLKDGEMND